METQLTRIQPFSKNHVSLRVLLLEEMVESTRAYVRAFTELGVDEVEVARNLAEAKRKVIKENQPYDLIVIDDSFWTHKDRALDLCRAIRSNEDYEHTALMMISDECDSFEIEEAFRSGVDEFVPKYTSLSELKNLSLQAILDRKQATMDL
jgi:PleD family two-component response regulator